MFYVQQKKAVVWVQKRESDDCQLEQHEKQLGKCFSMGTNGKPNSLSLSIAACLTNTHKL